VKKELISWLCRYLKTKPA